MLPSVALTALGNIRNMSTTEQVKQNQQIANEFLSKFPSHNYLLSNLCIEHKLSTVKMMKKILDGEVEYKR
jgi:hypothetical protein